MELHTSQRDFRRTGQPDPILLRVQLRHSGRLGKFSLGSLDGKNTPVLYTDGFNFPDKKARFALFEYVPPVEFPEGFDLTLDNGRLLEHFHEGNLTGKVTGIQYKLPEVFVVISLELAANRGAETGTWVRLESPYGAIKLKAVVTERVEGKTVYLPMHSSSHETAVNLLTGNALDVQTHTPAYKQTKVRMQALKEKGKNPLPSFNPRNAVRTPQVGVQVERKWDRSDYSPITDVNIPNQYKGAR